MPLYEERLSKDMARIRDEVASLGAAVQKAQEDAVQAALTGNQVLANQTILHDHPINRRMREINRLCHAFLAIHLPSAGHLRTISSILRLVNELERIGDYAATIAREGLQLPHQPTGVLKQEMEELAEQAQTCLRQAIKSFNEKDAELARETMAVSAQGKGRGDMAFEDLVKESEASHEQIRYLFDALILIGRLKRVCDRCKNICEETLFTVTGETKPPKTYNVLFLDEENNCQSQIAAAVARKTFPNSGEFHSAGRRNGADLTPGLFGFMEAHGLVLGPIETTALEPDVHRVAKYDVVVSLQGPVSAYLPEQPFRTVFLDWDVGVQPEGLSEAEVDEHYTELYREITVRVRDLMEILRGEEAD
jgi:phosphate transport system protein